MRYLYLHVDKMRDAILAGDIRFFVGFVYELKNLNKKLVFRITISVKLIRITYYMLPYIVPNSVNCIVF